jgi:hypothetical protein
MKIFKFTLGIALIFVVAFFVVTFSPKKDATTGPVACTEEAMLCPDGSYVGRTGPSCQFAPCPQREEPVVPPQNNNDVWNTTTNKQGNITFSAPQSLGTEYIHPVEWPPEVELVNQAFGCKESGSEVLPQGQTQQKTIQNIPYCVTLESEGAAGSIYTKYTYAFAKDAQTVQLSFTLRGVQCSNYDEDKKSACEAERTNFDVDALSDKIAKTIRVE